MRKFLHINRRKWGFIFKRLLIGSAVIWMPLFFLPLTGKPGWLILLMWYLLFSLGLAFMLMVVIFTEGYFSYRRQEHLFGKKSLIIFFDKYHFQTDLINTDNHWHLTQKIKIGRLDLYPILIFRTPGKSQFINTVIEIDWAPREDLRSAELKTCFKRCNMTLGHGAVLKTMIFSDDIEEQIRKMVEIIKGNGLKPPTGKD